MMADYGSISAEQAATALEVEIALTVREERSMRAPYFVEYVRQQLVGRYGAERLYNDGLRVYTTLDWRIQNAAEEALEAQLAWLESVNEYETRRDSTWIPPEKPFVNSPYVQGPPSSSTHGPARSSRWWAGGATGRASSIAPSQAFRQPGSSFKPFVYTAAIEQGFGPSTIILDEPLDGADAQRRHLQTREPEAELPAAR